MDRTQRWTGCEHGRTLDGIVQYQRNLDRIELFRDEAAYLAAFRTGKCTQCRLDAACIDEQAEGQAYAIVFVDDTGFVSRHDATPLLMVFYRGVDAEQFAGWATKANQQMFAERIFWEFVEEDEAANGRPSPDVDALKARYERFHSYISGLAGLSWDDRNTIMDVYEGMLLVYLATPPRQS